MIVTDEETDVAELLWVVAIVDVDIWDVCCETVVILGVDFKVVEVIFAETPCVVIWEVAIGFTVTAVTFFEETGVVDGFAEDFEVIFVTEEIVLLEDSFL